ncbi:uncharacterized protein PFL1_01842 [Pseudozyma flocculosa PF-1]|uniref:IMS import disulfide relay-system CHCH-CHCH-like Cx9C domain-containing protein n=1 Tax=Pseudozyma flocculosa TaxID=84751 RepID=A0A5C3EYE2_9BASI|nr:uncharacterized protein PFL1_01842 [Pseudozyma flocculosa PF-1]EPQ30944.1 hypothetical protein PFL1_01842 [Pseudozyma flocculosa PF-1]SPO36666.1 uncharacterized protein PSFLO_02137 [Pseudozyma flocculosa]
MRPTLQTLKKRDMQPIQTFAKAAAQCAAPAKVYGACVAANYENVERNMCHAEFAAFKACVQEKLGRKW